MTGDDIANEAEAVMDAHTRIAAFSAAHRDEILAMILVYSDDQAEWILRALREKFWTST